MKNTYITIALVVVALAGAGGLIWFVGSGDTLTQQTGESTPDTNAAVATLHNGEITITRGELDIQIQQLAQNPQIQVPPAGEERVAFERLVLDQMIGGILLFEEAKKQGFTADDVAIESQLAGITAQYETATAFEAELAGAHLSREQLRENIARQIIVNQYYDKVAAEHPVSVSNEEIKALYDTQVVTQDSKPIFEDVEGEIRAYLEEQKTQEVLAGIIAELRASAGVEILI